MWLYPRIIVSKSHENTSKYVDTVNLFAKTWTKGHWPLDDLWPHICWGHMCDSTQGSFCPSPMGIHQCMRIQWSILQNLPHTYTYRYYIHILHTTYRISDHIVSFWTTFRRDKKLWPTQIWHVCCSEKKKVKKKTHLGQVTYYIHILHTTYRISDHIVSFWTTFRRDKKLWPTQIWHVCCSEKKKS